MSEHVCDVCLSEGKLATVGKLQLCPTCLDFVKTNNSASFHALSVRHVHGLLAALKESVDNLVGKLVHSEHDVAEDVKPSRKRHPKKVKDEPSE